MSANSGIAQDMFKAAQSSVSWLISAERLRDAAEVILQHEVQFEIPYFRAYDQAVQQALSIACTDGNTNGSAEISCVAPNYPAAQLLYAYAIENVLKGLIVANQPNLIDGTRINKSIESHNLLTLASTATFQVHIQEEPVLKALSELSVWAGRYPVALSRAKYIGVPNSDELLDYGSQNPIMREFFNRAMKEPQGKLPKPLQNLFDWRCCRLSAARNIAGLPHVGADRRALRADAGDCRKGVAGDTRGGAGRPKS